jgi:ADP-heptose:LPS heptosyltransferase
MVIPVVYSAARAYPAHTFTVLTQTTLLSLFVNSPHNLRVMGMDTRSSEKTFRGLLRYMFTVLRREDYDAVLDLHTVIRSRIICTCFRLRAIPVFVVNKDRYHRRRLTTRRKKDTTPLVPVMNRYTDVFRKAGLSFPLSFTSLFDTLPVQEDNNIIGVKQGRWIAVAPFARYRGKTYPPENMEKVVKSLADCPDTTVFLFGRQGQEADLFEEWTCRYPHVRNLAGRYPLDRELMWISRMDCMLCMDSANMHFASLVGVRVLSIWGATHPAAGFYGFRQRVEDAIQIDLPCRPCSVYGKRNCYRKDWACMTNITPEMILNRIAQIYP